MPDCLLPQSVRYSPVSPRPTSSLSGRSQVYVKVHDDELPLSWSEPGSSRQTPDTSWRLRRNSRRLIGDVGNGWNARSCTAPALPTFICPCHHFYVSPHTSGWRNRLECAYRCPGLQLRLLACLQESVKQLIIGRHCFKIYSSVLACHKHPHFLNPPRAGIAPCSCAAGVFDVKDQRLGLYGRPCSTGLLMGNMLYMASRQPPRQKSRR
ncbi:hypothetical protein J6590_046076 [Homalodisca vitripennis]|nr:hypothetical protein J6590_046076 [Homalodisca vitripennis]